MDGPLILDLLCSPVAAASGPQRQPQPPPPPLSPPPSLAMDGPLNKYDHAMYDKVEINPVHFLSDSAGASKFPEIDKALKDELEAAGEKHEDDSQLKKFSHQIHIENVEKEQAAFFREFEERMRAKYEQALADFKSTQKAEVDALERQHKHDMSEMDSAHILTIDDINAKYERKKRAQILLDLDKETGQPIEPVD